MRSYTLHLSAKGREKALLNAKPFRVYDKRFNRIATMWESESEAISWCYAMNADYPNRFEMIREE